tara:strand:+ start:627 stop:797 length:171 start_codon:yes stop_codon:yes gene_type:complete
MSYYRDSDPRNSRGIWDVLNSILEKMREIEILIDEHFVELDDGMHWVRQPMEDDEE